MILGETVQTLQQIQKGTDLSPRRAEFEPLILQDAPPNEWSIIPYLLFSKSVVVLFNSCGIEPHSPNDFIVFTEPANNQKKEAARVVAASYNI